MLWWVPYPMVRITVIFIGGILLGIFCPEYLPVQLAGGFLLFAAGAYFVLFFLLRQKRVWQFVSGCLGLSSVFLAGYLMSIGRSDTGNPDNFLQFDKPVTGYVCQISKAPEDKSNYRRQEVELERVCSNGSWSNVSGKSLLYVDTRISPFNAHYGDRLLVLGSPVIVTSPDNPGEFDFKEFLRYRDIFYQHFTRTDQIFLLSHEQDPDIFFYAQQLRSGASATIDRYVQGNRERAIAKALVLGVTDGLDDELQGAYAASGAMHILSVSGLHVGIIYGLILFALRPLKKQRWSVWIIAGLSLICLWVYAFITGLSPSVLRAVTMFSFIVIGRPVNRQSNIYNTLATSAFLLLIVDPFLIMSVGFQLSYLAVLGIIYIQRPLYDLWLPSSWFQDKVWQLVCVSLAAQIATFGLGLYYFHQFPVYFLISNLLVVPLSSIVLVVGIVMVCLGAFPVLAGIAGVALEFLIGLLNSCVFFIENLPYSLINNVSITSLQCWILGAVVICSILFLEHRKIHFLLASFILVMVFVTLDWRKIVTLGNSGQFIVYKIPGHGAMEWIANGQSYFYADSTLSSNPRLIRFHIQPARVQNGVDPQLVHSEHPGHQKTFRGWRILRNNGMTILWINNSKCELPQRVSVDLLVIGNDAVKSLELLRQKVSFNKVILDSSNSKSYLARIAKETSSGNLRLHSVPAQGAFVLKFGV